MPLPGPLQKHIELALGDVRSSPEHTLSPAHRVALYEAIEAAAGPKAHAIIGRLAVLTARRCLPVWERSAPEIPHEDREYNEVQFYLQNRWEELPLAAGETPSLLLDLAERALKGKMQMDVVGRAASDYWYVAENIIDEALEFGDIPMSAGYAFLAAVLALNDTAGLSQYRAANRSSEYTDEQDGLPDAGRDTASAAVLALAGAPWMGASDRQARLQFWQWWLTNGIDQAWEAANETDPNRWDAHNQR